MPTVQDILNRKGSKIVTVSPNETVQQAAARMKCEGTGSVLVLGDDRQMLGIFTERDVLHRVVAQRLDPAGTRVEEVMSPRVACCKPNTTLDECRTVMATNRIRHLPVVQDDQLVGLISATDILAQEVVAQQTTIEYLHAFLQGRM